MITALTTIVFNPYVLLLLVPLAFALGYLWPWRGRRYTNPKKHRLADAEYTEAWINGDPHLFTDEALRTARQRAEKFKVQ